MRTMEYKMVNGQLHIVFRSPGKADTELVVVEGTDNQVKALEEMNELIRMWNESVRGFQWGLTHP